jgi:hypothetical protein
MKKKYYFLSLAGSAFMLCLTALVVFLSLTLNGCGGDPPGPAELTESEKYKNLLTAGKWSPSSATNWVIVNGVDVSELFKDFTITFTATGYTTTGTTPVWPRTDTWKFKTEASVKAGVANIVIRNSDGSEVTIESLDDKTMKLSLLWNKETTEGGRSTSIIGKHEFTFSK